MKSKALDNKSITRAIDLDNLKVFDKLWYKGLLYKLSNYDFCKSFLSSSLFLMTCILEYSNVLFSIPIIFLLYINNFPAFSDH